MEADALLFVKRALAAREKSHFLVAVAEKLAAEEIVTIKDIIGCEKQDLRCGLICNTQARGLPKPSATPPHPSQRRHLSTHPYPQGLRPTHGCCQRHSEGGRSVLGSPTRQIRTNHEVPPELSPPLSQNFVRSLALLSRFE